MGESKLPEKIRNWEHPPWYGIVQFKERVILYWLSWRIRRVSSTTSRLTSGCRWSDKWFLVHVRKLHIPPSRRTLSPTLLSERRIIPFPLKYIDVSRTTQTNLDVKQEKRIDDYWNIDGSRDLSDPWTGFTQFYSMRKLLTDIHGPGGDWRENSLHPGQIIYGQSYGSQWERMPSWWKSKSGLMKSSILTTHENCEWSISSTPRIRNSKKRSRTRVRNWKRQLLLLCPVKLWKIVGVMDPTKLRQNLGVSWNLMNLLRECVWEIRCRIIMKTILQGKVKIHYSTTIWFTNLFLCLKLFKFLQQKQQWTRNGKNWRKFRRGTWPKSKVRKRWSMKQRRRALQFILHH